MEKPSIYEYLNYRLFLHDLLKARKGGGKRFTHREILKQMGITSTGFLSNVIVGKKNLTNQQINSLTRVLGFTQPEIVRFELMVYYTQARAIEEKKEYFDRLMRLHKVKLRHLKPKQFSLFSKWYYVYIRELINFFPFSGDFRALSRMLIPPISPAEAEEAVGELVEMGLLKVKNGQYLQTDKIVSTGDEVQSLHLANFQLTTMDMAKRALEKIPGRERDISFVSATLSEDGFRKIKQDIQKFRKRVLQVAREETAPSRVYQMNIQFFPVTKNIGDGV